MTPNLGIFTRRVSEIDYFIMLSIGSSIHFLIQHLFLIRIHAEKIKGFIKLSVVSTLLFKEYPITIQNNVGYSNVI